MAVLRLETLKQPNLIKMRKRIIFLILLPFLVLLDNYCQVSNRQLSLISKMNFAFIGTGDYPAFYFSNGFQIPVAKSVKVLGSLGILISSDDGKKDITQTHNISYINAEFISVLTPIDLNRFFINFNIGCSIRYRSEIIFVAGTTINSTFIPIYNTKKSIDLGYTGQIDLGFKISKKTSLFINLGLHSFNNGSGFSSLGIGIDLKI